MSLGPLVERLRTPLSRAVGAGELALLGETLREACDALLEARVLPPERIGPFKALGAKFQRWGRLSEDEREVEIARGLRLCTAIAGPARKPRKLEEPTGVGAAASVGTLPGIGPKAVRALAERGLATVGDLAWLVPRRYDDLRRVRTLAELDVGEEALAVTFSAEIAGARFMRWGRRFLEVKLADGEAKLTARWFFAHAGLQKRLLPGKRVVLAGPVKRRNGVLETANPEIISILGEEDSVEGGGIRPRYPEVEGVVRARLRSACQEAARLVARELPDGVPPVITEKLGLPPLGEALSRLHDPPATIAEDELAALGDGESPWHERLAFDELFFLALAVAKRRGERRKARAAPIQVAPAARAQAELALPFGLTRAQGRAVEEILADLASEAPMNRLLQGDVGAGKTAVAFLAAHAVIAAKRQVAFMAPTELLAEQHAATLRPWAEALGLRLALLTASTPRQVRESTLGLLGAGMIDLVVGTHALLAERVEIPSLGLCIIDEQHRFGVAQRVRLRSKGEVPHLLVMTATPIPRTLALTVYGDLDVSVLDELPPGRKPVATKVLAGARGRKAAYERVRKEVTAGGRVFVVCPVIEPSEDPEIDWRSATEVAEELSALLAPARVGLVHGRIPAIERDAQMAALRGGTLDILVATTVIEVGVDVPQATIMVVEDADRFGLAQLHQLRGRVGRGTAPSGCLLLYDGRKTEDAGRRLAVMEATTDGFKIAEEDLAIRGPGEILGVRQAGLPRLRFGDLVRHAALAATARREVEALLARDPELAAHPVTAAVLAARVAAAEAIGGDGG
jgi:ATP-dependent DNA helicase RecG